MIGCRKTIRPKRSYTNHSDVWFPVGKPVNHKITSLPANLLFLMVKGYNPEILSIEDYKDMFCLIQTPIESLGSSLIL